MIKTNQQGQRKLILLTILLLFISSFLVACDAGEAEVSEPPPATETSEDEPAIAAAPATWTPVPVVVEDEPDATDPPPPTNTAVPTSTIVPTNTAVPPTNTPEATATNTPAPTATNPPPTNTRPPATTAPPAATNPPPPTAAPAAPTAEPQLGANLLPNGSFEEGHYLQNGVAELQLPNKWRAEWSEAATGIGDATWDVYVRPEIRVLSTAFLPPHEHALYIYNGQHTVKVFKGSGAVDVKMLTDVTLEPGTYVIEAKMFADIVEKWENKQKVWALDPTAAEFRFVVGDGGTFWTPQRYGQINVHNYTFTIDQLQTIPVGIELKGKYAIANNGWFIDDLSLRRTE